MRNLLILLILLLLNAQNALAQEWFEAAESSGLGYEIPTKPVGGVELDATITEALKLLPSTTEFMNRKLQSVPAGTRGNLLPDKPPQNRYTK